MREVAQEEALRMASALASGKPESNGRYRFLDMGACYRLPPDARRLAYKYRRPRLRQAPLHIDFASSPSAGGPPPPRAGQHLTALIRMWYVAGGYCFTAPLAFGDRARWVYIAIQVLNGADSQSVRTLLFDCALQASKRREDRYERAGEYWETRDGMGVDAMCF